MVGYIYIFTNPAFPNLVKLGYANRWEERLKTLNTSAGLPYAFRCYATYKVNARLTDKSLFKLIDQLNPELRARDEINGKLRVREFFKMTPEEALNILDAIAKITGTERNINKIKKTSEDISDEKLASEDRRQPFRFSMIGMKPGDKIHYKKNKNIIAIIVDDSHVKYEDTTYSISLLAKELEKSKYPLQGPIFFTDANGKTLDQLRKEKGN